MKINVQFLRDFESAGWKMNDWEKRAGCLSNADRKCARALEVISALKESEQISCDFILSRVTQDLQSPACICPETQRERETNLDGNLLGFFFFQLEEKKPHQNTEMWFKLILKPLMSSHSRRLNKCTAQHVWELIRSTDSTSAPAEVLVWSFSTKMWSF